MARSGSAALITEQTCCVRISAIVDACFKLIVDGVSAPSWTRRDARKRGCNVSQASANRPARVGHKAVVLTSAFLNS
jgi:hypothetical protein